MIFQSLWLGIISGGLVRLNSVFGLLQLIEINYRPEKKFRKGFTGAPAAAGGGWEQTTGSLACSVPEVGCLFLKWGESRDVSRGQAGGVA